MYLTFVDLRVVEHVYFKVKTLGKGYTYNVSFDFSHTIQFICEEEKVVMSTKATPDSPTYYRNFLCLSIYGLGAAAHYL